MMMLDCRRHQWRRAPFSICIKRVASFVNAPSIIFARPHQMRRFPKVLTVVPCPDLSTLLVDAHAPRVAQPVSPDFRPGSFHIDEWVVLRHGIGSASFGSIDINAKNPAQQFA